MDELKARKILANIGNHTCICENNAIEALNPFVCWPYLNETEVCLDGDFTIEQLEALVWWMRNKKLEVKSNG